MRISTTDKNNWQTMDIEKCEWSSDHIPVISFESGKIIRFDILEQYIAICSSLSLTFDLS